MKYSVLNKPMLICEKELKYAKGICIAGIVVALILNLIFTLVSSDSNITLFLVLNILVDIVFGTLIYSYYILNIENTKRLLKLYKKERDTLSGTVETVCFERRTHMSIDCVEVKINNRILFLPENTIDLAVGDNVTVYYTSGIIVEVEK